jgi:alkylated DNA repair protein (DNA oxidative demethylase)
VPQFLAADARRLPLRTASIDLVLSTSTLDHFDSRREFVAAIADCSRASSGGRLVLTIDNPSDPRDDPQVVDQRFAGNDLESGVREHLSKPGSEASTRTERNPSRCRREAHGLFSCHLRGSITDATSRSGRSGRYPHMSTSNSSIRRRFGRSRDDGVPTALPDSLPSRQLALPIEPARLTTRVPLLPGVVHVSAWLDLDAQRALVDDFRCWALPPAGLRHARVPSGHLMSVQSVCLGWHWRPYAYSRTADDSDGAPVKPLPRELADLARAAVAIAYGPESGEAETYAPDAAIANFTRLAPASGCRRRGRSPVVTISPAMLACSVWRASTAARVRSRMSRCAAGSRGGGLNRRIYHGVLKVLRILTRGARLRRVG